MAAPAVDPILLRQELATALTLPELAQLSALDKLSISFEASPLAMVALYSTITSLVLEGPSLRVAQWSGRLMGIALSHPLLPTEKKSIVALQSLPSVARMLASSDIQLQKTGIQCFSSMYPLLFKSACAGNDHQTWNHSVALKDTVLRIWRNGTIGAKLAALKGVQRIIQTQTAGTADPRLKRTAEPSLSLCRPGHPFLNPRQLESEATELLEECIKSLFTSEIPDLISATTNVLSKHVKTRPAFSNLILTALSNWTPGALSALPNTQVRSVEKTIRICLTHLLKTGFASSSAAQITEFLAQQSARMEQAATDARRRQDQEASRKRQNIVEELSNPSKRQKLDSDVDTASVFSGVGAGREVNHALASFDVTALPLHMVVDLVISSFQALAPDVLLKAIDDARMNLPQTENSDIPSAPPIQSVIKNADPLAIDLGDEEQELKVDIIAAEPELEEEAEADAHTSAFSLDLAEVDEELVAPINISPKAATAALESAMRRICSASLEGVQLSVWAPLVSRFITRGPEADDSEVVLARLESLRGIVYDFIIGDIQSRMDFARLWLNEEWYVERMAGRPPSEVERPYDRWLRKLLGHITSFSTNKDKSFPQFIIELPEIPENEIIRLGEMCTKPDQVQLGFSALRDLAVLRPPVRQGALDILLSLATHTEKLTRNAAIITVKRWAPDVEPLGSQVIAFALMLFARLEIAAPVAEEVVKDEDDMDMDDEDTKEEITILPYAEVKNGQIIDRLPPPTTLPQVVQHAELLLALCVKNTELLMNIFESYPRLQPLAQDSLLTLITPLIRSLGATHIKIAEVIEQCPIGAEALVLRLLTILMDKGRLPAGLMTSVKVLASQRPLHPRFYVMFISECSKPDILAYLPRLVTLLNNTPEEKAIVRSAFLSVLASASQTAASQMQHRVGDQITPVELMVLLHRSEKEIGFKAAIESIAICFSMPDAFRPEVLAAFMQQVVDQTPLPVLFLRTVIQAVTTYKSLSAFITSILLARLISKNVWTTPPLWDGFIRLVKLTAPGSFGSVLQLPQEQLLDLIGKQPGLKAGLREFATQKIPRSHTRTAELDEALGEPIVEEIEPGEVKSEDTAPASLDD